MKKLNIGAFFAVLGIGLLAACSSTGGALIPVNLTNAQAEVAAVNVALKSEASVIIATLPASQQTIANKALAAEEAAAAGFASIPAGGSYATQAEAVISAVSGLVTVVPMPPTTAVEIQAGLGLVNALIAGFSSVPAPVAAPSTNLSATGEILAAPIPIQIFTPVAN